MNLDQRERRQWEFELDLGQLGLVLGVKDAPAATASGEPLERLHLRTPPFPPPTERLAWRLALSGLGRAQRSSVFAFVLLQGWIDAHVVHQTGAPATLVASKMWRSAGRP
jgi:hypothetical protein